MNLFSALYETVSDPNVFFQSEINSIKENILVWPMFRTSFCSLSGKGSFTYMNILFYLSWRPFFPYITEGSNCVLSHGQQGLYVLKTGSLSQSCRSPTLTFQLRLFWQVLVNLSELRASHRSMSFFTSWASPAQQQFSFVYSYENWVKIDDRHVIEEDWPASGSW